MSDLKASELHKQCRGRWLDIFRNICPGMFDDAISRYGQHVTCPLHGGAEDFRFIKKAGPGRENTEQCGAAMCSCGKFSDGFALLHAVMGGSFYDVLKEVDQYLNGTTVKERKAYVPVESVVVDDPAERAKIQKGVDRLWEKGGSWTTSFVPYYEERGIHRSVVEKFQDMKFIPRLDYFFKDGKATNATRVPSFGAMLGGMRMPDDALVAVHRTWLSRDRRAKAKILNSAGESLKVKKLTTTVGCAGAAIRLFDYTGSTVLGVTEGIETAAGVYQLSAGGYWPEFGAIPTWACYSERNVRNFIIPPQVLETLETLCIFADNDATGVGQQAAEVLKERVMTEHPHLKVKIFVPKKLGEDWLDVLNAL